MRQWVTKLIVSELLVDKSLYESYILISFFSPSGQTRIWVDENWYTRVCIEIQCFDSSGNSDQTCKDIN